MRIAWVSLLVCVLGWLPLAAQVDSLGLIRPMDPALQHPLHPLDSASPKQEPLPMESRLAPVLIHSISEVTVLHHYPGQLAGYSLITADSIAMRQAPLGTVADMVSGSGGAFVKAGAPATLATTSLRGGDAGHLPVYWLGVPVTSSMVGVSDLNLLPHGALGSWSIALGGAGLQVGGGGLAGTLLMQESIYPDGHQLDFLKGSFTNTLGSFGNWGSGLNVQGQRAGSRGRLSLFHSQGQNDYPYLNTAHHLPLEERLANAAHRQDLATAEFSQRLNRKERPHAISATANLWLQQAHRQLPVPMTSSPTGEWQEDQSMRLAAGLRGDHPTWDWSWRVVHLRDQLRYVHPVGHYDESSSQDGWASVGMLHHTHKLKPTNWWLCQSLQARAQHDRAFTPAYGEAATQGTLSAGYGLHFHAGGMSTLNLLIREEMRAGVWSPLLGSVGGNFAIRHSKGEVMRIKANATRNSRFPTLNMLHWQPGGNPDLKPELSHTAELGLEKGLLYAAAYGSPLRRKAFLSVNGYWSQVQNWIQWVPGAGGIWSPHNLKTVRSRGVESRLTWDEQIKRWNVEASLGHTWTEAVVTASHQPGDATVGKQLFYVPRHVGSAGLMLRRGATHVQAQGQFAGSRFTTPDNTSSLPGFLLLNASVGHRLPLHGLLHSGKAGYRHWVTVQAHVQNVLNTAYQVMPWRPMPGRSFGILLQYEFSKHPRS